MDTFCEIRIMGFLGKDLQLETLSSGHKKLTLSIATSYRARVNNQKWEQRTRWNYVDIWGKTAEYFAQYAGKGSMVYIEGYVETVQYTDRGGKNQYRTQLTGRKGMILRQPRSYDNQGNNRNAQPGNGNTQYYNDQYMGGHNNPPSRGGNYQNNQNQGNSQQSWDNYPDFIEDDIPF